jgi:hypothetical protein
VLANVVRDELLAVLGVHDVQSEGNTFLSIGLDGLLDPLGTVNQLLITCAVIVAYSSSSSGR